MHCHNLPFDPNNPTTRSLLVSLIIGRKIEEIPPNLRQRVADRCAETCNQYISEYLRIHHGEQSVLEYHNLLAGNSQVIVSHEELVVHIKEAYKSFVDLVQTLNQDNQNP